MRKQIIPMSVLLLCAALHSPATGAGRTANPADFRQVYPLDPAKVKANAQRAAEDLAKLPPDWKNAPLLYYIVDPMSEIKRLPDTYPSDGEVCASLDIVAAENEYEPGSFVVYPRNNVDSFILTANELRGPNGSAIPASALDIKIVKAWYQGGSAWNGYFSDPLVRVLVPEVLLYNENFIRVDCDTEDNYLLSTNVDGTQFWQWVSAGGAIANYNARVLQANQELIADAKTLQPAVLNKDEYKQFFVTARIPINAEAGVYTGSITMTADGKKIGSIPVRVRVLPFKLPDAKTSYDLNKGFYMSSTGADWRNPAVRKNAIAHNMHPEKFPRVSAFMPELLEEDLEILKEHGLPTRPILTGLPGCNIRVLGKEPSVLERKKLDVLRAKMTNIAAQTTRLLGHTDFYSYAVDEAGPDRIRQQREAWRIIHDAGGRVSASTYPWRKLLFALDSMGLPGQPGPRRIRETNKFHEAHPDSIVSWYADPHAGPENPDYVRRLHGFISYKSNYDRVGNYAWWRNDWNDFYIPYEWWYRGLIFVYGVRDGVLDTLHWEAMREAVDDVRYATLLKTLAREAAGCGNGDTVLLGRRAQFFLAYADELRENVDAIRFECINYILQLQNAIGKGDQK